MKLTDERIVDFCAEFCSANDLDSRIESRLAHALRAGLLRAAHPVADAAENFTLTVHDGAHIPNADERAAFEEWAEHPDDPLDLSPSGQWFMDPDTNLAWSAYQAGAEWQRKQDTRPVADAAVAPLTDGQIIARCAAAGIKWIAPELPGDTDWEMGFPGSFDMVSMDEMRALLAAPTPTVADAAVAPDTTALQQLLERWWQSANEEAAKRTVDAVGVAAGIRSCANSLRSFLAAPTPTVAADAAAPISGMERAFSSDAMCRRDEIALLNRHAETPRLLALLGLPLIDSIALHDVRVRLEHALDASEGKLDEEAHVAQRMTETLADVYATIIGDDPQRDDDSLNAIERVKKAAQVLRLEVDLYRAQRKDAAVAQPDVRMPSRSDMAYWNDNRSRILGAIEKAGFRLMSNRDGFWLHAVAAERSDERAAFEWPPLPAFPESFAHVAGHAYFTEHQMQGYANAYGEAVHVALQARAASQATVKRDEHLRREIAQMPVQQGGSVTSDDVTLEGNRSPITGDRSRPHQQGDTGVIDAD